MFNAKLHPTPLELEVTARLTVFQAQQLRDAFEEQRGERMGGRSPERDEDLAARVGVEVGLVRDFRRCRWRSLVTVEVPIATVRALCGAGGLMTRSAVLPDDPPTAVRRRGLLSSDDLRRLSISL